MASTPSAKPAGFSSEASKGYALISAWEKAAPLDAKCLEVIASLSLCAELPAPEHLKHESLVSNDSLTDHTPEHGLAVPEEKRVQGDWEKKVLHNSRDFFTWYSDLSRLRRQQIEGEYDEYLTSLSDRLRLTTDITQTVDRSLTSLARLKEQNSAVSAKMAQLKKSCQRLMHEKEMLIQYANALSARLGCFDELEAISAAFQALPAQADSEAILPLLRRLDDCIAYMASNPRYMDTMAYALRLRQLQVRAIGLVLARVQSILQRGVAVVKEEIQRTPTQPPSGQVSGSANAAGLAGSEAEGAPVGPTTAMLCVRFQAAVHSQLAPILAALTERRKQEEYGRLLGNIEAAFCSARQQLVLPVVQKHIAQLGRSNDLVALARQGTAYLLDVCQAEAQLHRTFFSSTENLRLQAELLEALCDTLQDALRPRYIHLQNLDDLVALVDVLRNALAAMGATAAATAGAPTLLEAPLRRLLADVQERLIFQVATYLRGEVFNYEPGPDDVDYPACLIKQRQARAANADLDGGGNQWPSAPPTPATAPSTPNTSTGPAAPPEDDFNTWYPALRRTLLCLSKLYRAVELPAFCGLGQDALLMCTHAIQQAGKLVLKRSSNLDAHLFTIRHLLLLREQISPFQTEFRAMERDLDFTHMRTYLLQIMEGKMPLFQLSRDNAVLQMMAGKGFKVAESQVDGKKELEKTLKGCCEAYIMAVTKSVVEPFMSFLTKVAAAKAAAQAANAPGKRLTQHAFAAVERVTALIDAVNKSLEEKFPAAVEKTMLYLTKPKTQSVLLKPIKSNIMEAHSQVAKLLASEYSAEEAASMPLKTTAELQNMLN